MTNVKETRVRWLQGFFISHSGTLVMNGDRVTLIAKGAVKLELDRAEWGSIVWPWYTYGTAFKIKGFTVSFVPLQPSHFERAQAMDEAAEWRNLLGGGGSRETGPTMRGFSILGKQLAATAGLTLGVLLAVAKDMGNFRAFWALVALVSAASFVVIGRSARK